MLFGKIYSRIVWRNQPSTESPVGAMNLNKMDVALNTLDDRVVTLDTTKLPVNDALTMVANWDMNLTTGVITVTLKNGTVKTFDTALEKVPISGYINTDTNKLIFTNTDGSTTEVDISKLVTQYEFVDSSTIGFLIGSDGKVSCFVKDGSITASKLETNYLANITIQAQSAEASKNAASASADLSKRYAVGGVSPGDTTDNSKYYMEQAKLYRDEAEGIVGVGIATDTVIGLVKGNGNVEVNADGAMWANTYRDKATITGTFAHFTTADNGLGEITNIQGKTLETLSNPLLEKSPDNPATFIDFNQDGTGKARSCGKQLFNKATSQLGMGLNGATGTTSPVADRFTSDYISIYPSMQLIPSGTSGTASRKLAFYDKDKVFISGNASNITFTSIPPNARYYRIGDNLANNDTIQIELGTVSTPYEPYKQDEITISWSGGSIPGTEIRDMLDTINGKSIQRVKKTTINGSNTIATFSDLGENVRFNIQLDTYATSGSTPVAIPSITSHFKTVSANPTVHGTCYIQQHQDWNGVRISICISKTFLTTPNSSGVSAWLNANPVTVLWGFVTLLRPEIVTDISYRLFLKSWAGITNVFWLTNMDTIATWVAKSELWSRDYLQDVGIADTKKKFADIITALTGKLDKTGTSIAVSVNPANLELGHYRVEGAFTTANGYPYTTSFAHATLTVTGYGAVGSNGYRVIQFTDSTGAIWIKTQSWDTWSGWFKVIKNTDLATTDTENDVDKGLGANVGYTLGQEIDTANGKLAYTTFTPTINGTIMGGSATSYYKHNNKIHVEFSIATESFANNAIVAVLPTTYFIPKGYMWCGIAYTSSALTTAIPILARIDTNGNVILVNDTGVTMYSPRIKFEFLLS